MSAAPTAAWLGDALAARLDAAAAAWLEGARAELGAGADPGRTCALVSLAARRVPRGPLAPTAAERGRAAELLEGWDPERWSLSDAARAALVLAHPGLAGEGGPELVEELFRYADVGELVALYRALAHLPEPGRFAWRAREGARTNMRSVFEAACCDTPYPWRWFDDLAWRQALLKALFVGAPLARVFGVDRRLSPELARMALDYADERRSAGRAVPPELWVCLGPHGGPRGLASLERELDAGDAVARAGAALGLARAGELERLRARAQAETDPMARATMAAALAGRHDASAFRDLAPEPS